MNTRVFSFTGGSQTFVVPPGVNVVAFNALGAAGGGVLSTGGGLGGRVSGLMVVNPGETLTVNVGGAGGRDVSTGTGAGGTAGFNGGGPGGAACGSPCREIVTGARYGGGGGGGATTILKAGARVVVAGGGGGAGGDIYTVPGGAGGGLVGMPGSPGSACDSTDTDAAPDTSSSMGGMGGNAAVGVTGGGAGGKGARAGATGAGGASLSGGAGGSAEAGGTGGGGGGGGGYFGGGGGGGGGRYPTVDYYYLCSSAGGGGGSSWADPLALVAGPVAEPGVNPVAGHATLAWVEDGGPVPVGVVVTTSTVRNAGQAATVTAKVVDQKGNPMAGKVVTFDRKGANPGTTSATTGSTGEAHTTYTGTGGAGADVITASTPSLANVPVSGVGTMAWVGTPSQKPPVAVVFVPPVVQGPVGTSMALPFRVVNPGGVPVSSVSYCVNPASSTNITGCATSGTAALRTDVAGQHGEVNVTPTAASSMLRVTAHASAVRIEGPDEVPIVLEQNVSGAGLAIGVTPPPPPTVPDLTTVVFDPPVAKTAIGTATTLRFTARKGAGTFSGTVWVRTGPPQTVATAPAVAYPAPSGTGSINITPSTDVPNVQVLAYADNPSGGQVGAPDATEVTATAVVAGTPTTSPGTVVAFTPPVGAGANGSAVRMPLIAYNLDGSPFQGVVNVRTSDPQSQPVLTHSAQTNEKGEGSVDITPTAAKPIVRVVAYADRLTGGSQGTQDPTEVAGEAAVVSTTPPPPPPVPEVTTVVFDPPVKNTAQGTATSVSFTARKGAGTFSGTVWYRTGAPGLAATAPATPLSVTSGTGSIPVTPTAATPVVQVLAYADNPSAGQVGAQDPTEATGSAAVIGTPVTTTSSPGTVVSFVPPVATGPAGSNVAMKLVARHLDGMPFDGTVRVSRTAPGSTPSYSTTVDTDANGEATVTATPTATTPVQVVVYADRAGTGFGTQDATEAAGAGVAVSAGVPPPPSATGSVLVFTNPAAGLVPPGVSVSVQFIARRHDGGAFTGKVRWGIVRAGSVPSFPNEVDVTDGTGFITVMTESAPVQVVGYADRPVPGLTGVPDAGEVPGATNVIPMD